MNEVLKLRVILDAKEDVFRDIEIKPEQNLEILHKVILKSFGLAEGEMSSFYKSDVDWNQGDEIPFMDMGMSKEPLPLMRDVHAGSVLSKNTPNLLFVYDFFNMWTFFVEFISEVALDESDEYPRCTYNYGATPESAPVKDFGGEAPKNDLFGDAFSEEDSEDQHFDENEDYWN
jgi:hypothetical protein